MPEELANETRLADARDADERDELRRALLLHAPEDRPQKLELPLAPDERRLRALDEVDSEPGDGIDRFPDAESVPPCPFPWTGGASRNSIACCVAR